MYFENRKPVIVIGAGMAGIAAAIALAAKGERVLVVEKEAAPGGKMRHVHVPDSNGLLRSIDAGPTVMTMKWVFDELLESYSTNLDDEIRLVKSSVLARHYWTGGANLDLFADIDESADAIGRFSTKSNSDGYRRFCADSRTIFETLKCTYIAAERPGPIELSSRIGFFNPQKLWALKPFSTMWSALGGYFPDARLQQLFGRYATYCGSSPFLSPATLMLVSHVEQEGVWLVEGGMHGLAKALSRFAERHGVEFRYRTAITEIKTKNRCVKSAVLADGQEIATDQVIYNGDVSGLQVLLDDASSVKKTGATNRSLSAMVSCLVTKPKGVGLAHHTVFFGDNYRNEFDAVFRQGKAPDDPTVYVCAQDRTDIGTSGQPVTGDEERLYLLMNMPANGDRKIYSESEKRECLEKCLTRLSRSGLAIDVKLNQAQMTGPTEFNALFPGSGGALYGQASHGWMASFQRQGSRTKIRGLYLAGGSVHPGPGVPMAALSGRIAAQSLLADRALIP